MSGAIDLSSNDYYISSMLRSYEKKTIVEPDQLDLQEGEFSIIAVFDVSKDYNLNSYLGIGRTLFVCLVLSASVIFLSKDATELVLDPIENMLKKVMRISKDPIKAARIEEE